MGLGVIQFEGRSFEYSFEEPSEQAISTKMQDMMNEDPTMDEVAARNYATEIIRSETARKTEKKVAAVLKEGFKKLRDARAESGIAMRITSEINLKKIDKEGLITREITPRSDPTRDARLIQNSDAAKFMPNLAAELNNHLLSIKQIREAGDAKLDIGKDKLTVDLKIPDPSESLLGDQIHEMAVYLSGAGDEGSQYAQEMSRLNRFARALIPGGRELTGFTFITRPHLNLCQANLANVRTFAPLLYADDQSTSMAIRMLLDNTFASKMQEKVKCELFDIHNPFLTPVVNGLQSISGFPDPTLSVETTEGGFFSEQQTCVIGYDRLAHGQDLQLQFKDLPGGPIMAIHDFWTQYCGFITDGTMSQYLSDIEQNLMGYTVSIYRFITDATGRQITRWAKATGCFPKMVPSGTVFNTNPGEHVVTAVREFSAPWWAHHFSYNDPIILREFNMLVERYNSWIVDNVKKIGNGYKVEIPRIKGSVINNRAGIPYITQENGFTELIWLANTKNYPERKIVSEKSETTQTWQEQLGEQSLDHSLVFPH